MLDKMVAEPKPYELSSLIGAIYDCALDPSRWEQTLDELRQAFDGLTAILYLSDLRDQRILINRTVGMAPAWLEMLNQHTPEISARAEVGVTALISRAIEVGYSAGEVWSCAGRTFAAFSR